MNKAKRYQTLIPLILALILSLTGCGAQKTYSSVEHTEYGLDEIDFSKQAQAYMEYIGTNMPDRSGLFGNHDDARNFIVTELIDAGYSKEQIVLQKVNGKNGENISVSVRFLGYNETDKSLRR